MRKIKPLAILASLALLTACQGVPATRVNINPKTGALTVKSPKEIEVKGLHYRQLPDGSVQVDLDSYASKNSPDVIAAVSASNASLADSTAKLGNLVIQGAAAAAAKGVVP